MKYEKLVEEFKKDINKELEELSKLPDDYSTKYSMLLKSEKRFTDSLTDIPSITKALQQAKEFEFNKDEYLKVTTEVTTDVDAYAVDNEIFIDGTEVFIESVAIGPIDKDRLNKLLGSKYSFTQLFKEYLVDKISKENATTIHTYWVDCKLLELYKNDILTYDQFIQSILTSCKV
jgi:hypothetical protein